jgi:hypothetical protein
VGKFGRVSEVVSQSVPLGTRWRGAAVSVQRCFVPRTSTRLITKFAPLGAKMAEQAVGLTRRGQAVGWRGVGKPWRRKKLRHYSAERTVPRTAADAAGHVISPRCGSVWVGECCDLWQRWLCRPRQRLPYLRRQGGLLPPPRGVSGVSVTAKPTRDKRWVRNPQGVGGVDWRCVRWLRTTGLRWSTRRGCTQ